MVTKYLRRCSTVLMTVMMFSCLLLTSPVSLPAAEQAQPLNYAANTQGLSGIELWYAQLYNQNKFYCALVTILIIPIVGFILGTVADFLICKTGLDLKSRAK